MQKFLLHAMFLLLVCAACRQEAAVEPLPDGVAANPQPSATPAPRRADSLWAERRALLNDELEYYLSRHNVDDEGFDMVARYAEKGDSLLAAYVPRSPLTPLGMLALRNVPRKGTGILRVRDAYIIIGEWQADTLTTGIRIDPFGIYAGQFDRYGQPHGHGAYRTTDGSYYEGHFHRGLRNGFGFSVSPRQLLAGIWKNDRFLGERMRYSSDRIYGIDISRYQHERGRKRFSIDWKHLRITSFGHKPRPNATETVDYPVTFAYIKATEGISIHNRYFAADHAAARRQGIRVGAYHFFSTRQSGRMQANYFLSKATFSSGDLPPMLDVEPSDALIRQMGGVERLFAEVRAWIEVVERRTGARPLLYVNQRFVRKYLDEAPDLKQNYLIWIARYGEYKPDVHLALWQLSADGRVRGINGEVDINVFNGYEGQWNEFLDQECIARPVR